MAQNRLSVSADQGTVATPDSLAHADGLQFRGSLVRPHGNSIAALRRRDLKFLWNVI